MDQLNWYWIGMQAIVPPLVGGLIALPFWRRDQAIFGNIFGTVIIFGAAFALIMREHIALDVLIRACFDAGEQICSPNPSAFARFAIYSFIALFQGYEAKPTPEGVSRATTKTVVYASLAVLGLDFLLTALMFS